MNILLQAFKDCAKDKNKTLYEWLNITPETTITVNLVEKLNELGYFIKRNHYPLT